VRGELQVDDRLSGLAILQRLGEGLGRLRDIDGGLGLGRGGRLSLLFLAAGDKTRTRDKSG
jgi:hypothetical protein